MNVLTRRHLDRRTLLRSLGATVALPFLDAMVPAFTPSALAAARKVRMGHIYVAHGAIMDAWTPAKVGPGIEFTGTLGSLARHRAQVNILSNLVHNEANSNGDGPADHTRAVPCWLGATRPRKTEGEDVRAAKTADQMAADVIGQDTLFPSLEIGTEDMSQLVGACDIGYSCTYINSLSWKTATMPLPMEVNPRLVFERMFGAETDPVARRARLAADRSILDEINGNIARLKQGLGAADQVRLDQYLDNLREIERRIQVAETMTASSIEIPTAPIGIPDSFDEHIAMMFDLMAVAFEADLTRVFTFMMVRDLSQRTYPHLGAPDPHHATSHHQLDPVKIAQLTRINQHHVSLFSNFLDRLAATPDADGTLLDNSMLLYGSGISDSDNHTHDPLPTLLAGGGAGTLQGDRHLAYPSDTPMANLLVSMLNKAGVPTERLGDSTGELSDL